MTHAEGAAPSRALIHTVKWYYDHILPGGAEESLLFSALLVQTCGDPARLKRALYRTAHEHAKQLSLKLGAAVQVDDLRVEVLSTDNTRAFIMTPTDDYVTYAICLTHAAGDLAAVADNGEFEIVEEAPSIYEAQELAVRLGYGGDLPVI